MHPFSPHTRPVPTPAGVLSFPLPTVVPLLLIATGVLLTACSGHSDGPAAHRFTRTEEEGIPVSLSSGAPLYEGELFTYEEVCRLEQDEAREETILYQAYQYLRGPNGRYYVSDNGNGRIAVFGEQGEYLFCFGREGDGPGEFRYGSLQTIDDECVCVYDQMNRRATRFGLDGTFLDYVTLSSGDFNIRNLYPLPDGRHLTVNYENDYSDQNHRRSRYCCQLIAAETGDTLATVNSDWNDMGRMVRVGNIGFTSAPTFTARSYLTYKHGLGILCYDSSRPEMSWYALDGSVSRIMRLDWEPVPVTDEDRAGYRRMYENRRDTSERDDMRDLYDAQLKRLEFNEYFPLWSGISIDDSGFLWLGRPLRYIDWEPEQTRTYSYRILSPDGEYLGDTTRPHAGTLSRGHLLTRQEDEETGEVTRIVYRIVPIPEDLIYPD